MELFLRGDQIATYASASQQGNSNGTQVTLNGIQTLGSASDTFRIVVRQYNPGDSAFQNGQQVDIYAWPDTEPPAPPLFTNLNPQHDMFQGRASSGTHQIFSHPAKVVFDLNGLTGGTVRYGPGNHPPLNEKLTFDALPDEPPAVPCFTPGTRLLTPRGMRAVETLRPGDLVVTLDHGPRPLLWTGRRQVAGIGPFAPVHVAAGALGNRRALLVSPQHRFLIRDWRSDLWFGAGEVLVAARHLVDGTTVTRRMMPEVTYLHIAFDRHEMVLAEGIATESLHLGQMGLAAMDPAQRRELLHLFPELSGPLAAQPQTARPCLRGWEAGLLAAA